MRKAIEKIFRSNLAIQEGERVLIITDAGMRELASRFFELSIEKKYPVEVIEVSTPKVHGVEPDARVRQKMLDAQVIFIITTKSLSHTMARSEASKNGARIATMSGVSESILRRFEQVDLDKMKERTNRIADVLDEGKQVRLVAQSGTDLTFSIAGRLAHGRKASIFDRPGYWGNIPCGEAFIAPVEQSVNGVLVVDASIANIGLLDKAVVVRIENGKATDIEGGTAAQKLRSLLDNRRKRQVAEFGIGTNDTAQVTGVIIEDEKKLGTCHIAFGNNLFFGGANQIDFHMDCVLLRPEIYVDGRTLSLR